MPPYQWNLHKMCASFRGGKEERGRKGRRRRIQGERGWKKRAKKELDSFHIRLIIFYYWLFTWGLCLTVLLWTICADEDWPRIRDMLCKCFNLGTIFQVPGLNFLLFCSWNGRVGLKPVLRLHVAISDIDAITLTNSILLTTSKTEWLICFCPCISHFLSKKNLIMCNLHCPRRDAKCVKLQKSLAVPSFFSTSKVSINKTNDTQTSKSHDWLLLTSLPVWGEKRHREEKKSNICNKNWEKNCSLARLSYILLQHRVQSLSN